MSSTVFVSNDGSKSSASGSSGHLLKYFKRKLASSNPPNSSGTSSAGSSNASSPATSKKPSQAEQLESAASRIHDCSFVVAVSEDYNLKFRRTMEDAHVYIYNFADIPDSGYFAIFDGHAGAEAAHWCSKHLHSILEASIRRTERGDKKSGTESTKNRKNSISAGSTKSSDSRKKRIWSSKRSDSTSPNPQSTQDAAKPCPAAKTNDSKPPTDQHHDYTAQTQKQSPEVPPNQSVSMALNFAFNEADAKMIKDIPVSSGCTAAVAVIRWEPSTAPPTAPTLQPSSTPCSPTAEETFPPSDDDSKSSTSSTTPELKQTTSPDTLQPPTSGPRKFSVSSTKSTQSQNSFVHSVVGNNRARVLYTANVGDARIVLCRGGKALRLSYDHKGSDANECARITNCGGVVYGNRVNGMLAVTRALGDGYMKSLITGSPYTTRTNLGPTDEFIIVACDGIWDVCSDQNAVDLVRDITDPKQASQKLVKHAIDNFSSDNITCMIIRLDPSVCTT